MPNSRHRLPSLSALPAFEAAARLQSFTRAAEELNVTQAAISSQIRTLEENLGNKLFTREHRKITLTEAGQQFQHAVSVALELVGNSADKLRGQAAGSSQTLAADTSMAYLWLLPRFAGFSERFPDIPVNILATEKESDCMKNDVDLALLYGNGDWPGYDATLLFTEEVFPVCSPAYLQKHPALRNGNFAEEQLLDLKGQRWDWVDWQHWLVAKDVAVPENIRILGFNNLPLLIQAACQGQGVGLGWGTLVERYLEDGSLVRLTEDSLKTGRGYYLIKRRGIRLGADTQSLFEWILTQNRGLAKNQLI
ncbi:MAG: LysR substrate-binding domain-containing protein [Thiolinea sp.]